MIGLRPQCWHICNFFINLIHLNQYLKYRLKLTHDFNNKINLNKNSINKTPTKTNETFSFYMRGYSLKKRFRWQHIYFSLKLFK